MRKMFKSNFIYFHALGSQEESPSYLMTSYDMTLYVFEFPNDFVKQVI